MALDLLLRGGMLVDPHQGIGDIRDIGVRGGRIAFVAEAVSEGANHDPRRRRKGGDARAD